MQKILQTVEPDHTKRFTLEPLYLESDDIHAWSRLMSESMQHQCPDLPRHSQAARALFPVTAQNIMAHFREAAPHRAPMVEAVLRKLEQRRQRPDSDLCGVSGAGLCVLFWDVVRGQGERESFALFADTLEEVGQTCLQGDTHRLFWAYLPLLDHIAFGSDPKSCVARYGWETGSRDKA